MELFERLTHAMSEAIESGVSLALHAKNQEVDISHVVWGLLTNTGSILNQALNKMNKDKAVLELEAKSVVGKLPTSSSVTKENIKISFLILRIGLQMIWIG
jgi:ATP-dependent Clp protease ATP-binding subunit ClpB